MKILWQLPHKNLNNANRTIVVGYKRSFENYGHTFRFLTAEDSFWETYSTYKPDLFFTSLNSYYIKYLNLDHLTLARKDGLMVFSVVPSWKDPGTRKKANEIYDLHSNSYLKSLVVNSGFADVYYSVFEKEDPRICDFEKDTGQLYITLPLAADSLTLKNSYSDKFYSDISYIGTNLPDKREFFKEYLFPLKDSYDLRLYGQDWTFIDRTRNNLAKVGKYLNIKYLKDLNKINLSLEDEAKIYNSSTISINIHQSYQRRYGGDTNERTFKIPFCGGFEITDYVKCLDKYFDIGKELIVARSSSEWFEKIEYYVFNSCS